MNNPLQPPPGAMPSIIEIQVTMFKAFPNMTGLTPSADDQKEMADKAQAEKMQGLSTLASALGDGFQVVGVCALQRPSGDVVEVFTLFKPASRLAANMLVPFGMRTLKGQ